MNERLPCDDISRILYGRARGVRKEHMGKCNYRSWSCSVDSHAKPKAVTFTSA